MRINQYVDQGSRACNKCYTWRAQAKGEVRIKCKKCKPSGSCGPAGNKKSSKIYSFTRFPVPLKAVFILCVRPLLLIIAHCLPLGQEPCGRLCKMMHQKITENKDQYLEDIFHLFPINLYWIWVNIRENKLK